MLTRSAHNDSTYADGHSPDHLEHLHDVRLVQEVITLAVFVVFAYFYLGEAIRWNHVASFGCIMGALVLAFW